MKKSITVAFISLMFLYGCGHTVTPTAATSTITSTSLTSNTKPANTETPYPTLIDLVYPTVTIIPNKTHIILPPTVTPLPTSNSPSSTPIPQTPWPTLIYTSTLAPNETILPLEPTITAPPTRISPILLPGNLQIEEYNLTGITSDIDIKQLVLSRHPESGGWYYWPKGGTLYGKPFRAEEIWVDNHVRIRATLDDKEILLVDCTPASVIPSVITAWVIDEHWIIQSICHQEFDIYWDGISLNATKDYQSSFGFQILGQRPFYLFERDRKIWLSYDGQEALLGYDKVKLSYCCDGYSPPQHYENLIAFYATKNDDLYYVVIGLFDK